MRRFLLLGLASVAVACSSPRDKARADSAQALASQQRVLMDKLSAQRDSVSQLLGDANVFIGHIDKSISRVKGLSAASNSKPGSESGLEDQLRARKDMLRRVDALVERARATAQEVTALRSSIRPTLLADNAKLGDENKALKDSLAADEQRIASMMSSIEQQAQTIALLQTRIDDLGKDLANCALRVRQGVLRDRYRGRAAEEGRDREGRRRQPSRSSASAARSSRRASSRWTRSARSIRERFIASRCRTRRRSIRSCRGRAWTTPK